MEKKLLTNEKQSFQTMRSIIMLLVLLGTFGPSAYSQIATTTSASRCGSGSVTLTATATSGEIKWYAEPFYGTPLATGASFTTPSLGVTTTYFVDALDEHNCSRNDQSLRVPVTATISATSMQPVIYYASSMFCKAGSGEQSITISGNLGGAFTYTTSGDLTVYGPGQGSLTIDANGKITPATSRVGTYTIAYTAPSVTGCTQSLANTVVSIANVSTTPVIAYSNTNICSSSSAVIPSPFTGGAIGGSFSAIPSGLSIKATTGEITPSTSKTGTYTITYSVPGAGGCAPQTSEPVILKILQLPTASISYGSPSFTQNQGSQPVVLTGTGVYTGGTFASTTGLIINASTGAIDPSSSTAGTYTVTYTLAAVSPCGAPMPATTSVTIYGKPEAQIEANSTAVCREGTEPAITFTGSGGAAPYTFVYTINNGGNQDIKTTTGSSVTINHPTLVAGTYMYKVLSVSDSHGATSTYAAENEPNLSISVSIPAVATFVYSGSPYCSEGSNPAPTMLDGGKTGTFSSAPGLVFVDNTTGVINPSASTPGSYTVTNTIAAKGGCGDVTATASVIITKLPVATFTYAESSYCSSGGDPSPTMANGASIGIFTSMPAGVVFVSASTGEIDLSASAPGAYTINKRQEIR